MLSRAPGTQFIGFLTSNVLPVGKYSIAVGVTDFGNSSPFLSSLTDLLISPAVPDGLNRLFAVEFSNLTTRPADQQTLSVQKIAYSRSPDAVPYLARIFADPHVSIFDKLMAVEGIGRIHSLRAVAILRDIIAGKPWIIRPVKGVRLPDVYELNLKRNAISAAYEMYDNSKTRSAQESKILGALEPIIRNNPRPTRPLD